MASSAQRQWLVSVSGISGYFNTKTGGDTTSDTTKVYNGGQLVPEILAAPAETDNIIVSRAYDHGRDYQAHVNARAKVGRWRTTVSVTPTDEDEKAVGKPTVYANALLVRVSEPDYDASSGDASTFELEFAVSNVK